MTKNKDICFYPENFENLNLNWDDFVWSEEKNFCSPQAQEDTLKNFQSHLVINCPENIIFNKNVKKVIIPLAVLSQVTNLRSLKYSEQVYDLKVHIKGLGNKGKISFSERLYNKNYQNGNNFIPPYYSQHIGEWINDAKKLSDEELNYGTRVNHYLTINLSDFITLPISNGVYEIYCTKCNIESNHRIVKIKRLTLLQKVLNYIF